MTKDSNETAKGDNTSEVGTVGSVTDVQHPTIGLILKSARHILMKYGYNGFTTRRVAKKAAISPGNLSYHFHSKQRLIQAVIIQLTAEYSSNFEATLSSANFPQGQEIELLVKFILNDAVVKETVQIYRELWAMSLHDDVICRAVDDFYDDMMEIVFQLFRRSYPEIEEKSIRELVQILALMSEGTAILYGTRQERVVKLERIIEIITPLLKTTLSLKL